MFSILRVTTSGSQPVQFGRSWTHTRFIPFVNLRILDLSDLPAWTNIIDVIARSCPSIEFFYIGLPDVVQFPALCGLPCLKDLHIKYVRLPAVLSYQRPTLIGHPSLTVLSVEEFYGMARHEMWQRILFPCLQSFTVVDTHSRSVVIYDFIRRHTTILDVNVSFARNPAWLFGLSITSLVKLIDGTGKWIESKSMKGEPDLPWHDHKIAIEDLVDHNHARFTAFGFVRRPICGYPTIRRGDPNGTAEPRYTATALSVRLQRTSSYLLQGATQPPSALAVLALHRYFPHVEELQISSHSLYQDGWSFSQFMVCSLL